MWVAGAFLLPSIVHNAWHNSPRTKTPRCQHKIASGNNSGCSNSLLALRLRFWRGGHQPGKIVGNPRCFCYNLLLEGYRRALNLIKDFSSGKLINPVDGGNAKMGQCSP